MAGCILISGTLGVADAGMGAGASNVLWCGRCLMRATAQLLHATAGADARFLVPSDVVLAIARILSTPACQSGERGPTHQGGSAGH